MTGTIDKRVKRVKDDAKRSHLSFLKPLTAKSMTFMNLLSFGEIIFLILIGFLSPELYFLFFIANAMHHNCFFFYIE